MRSVLVQTGAQRTRGGRSWPHGQDPRSRTPGVARPTVHCWPWVFMLTCLSVQCAHSAMHMIYNSVHGYTHVFISTERSFSSPHNRGYIHFSLTLTLTHTHTHTHTHTTQLHVLLFLRPPSSSASSRLVRRGVAMTRAIVCAMSTCSIRTLARWKNNRKHSMSRYNVHDCSAWRFSLLCWASLCLSGALSRIG